MRFVHVSMTGFAGVAGSAEVDLDASVVVLLAQNGYGKSTICDALAWALSGQHPRGADPRSKYGSGETQVAVILRDEEGREWSIRRIIANPAESNVRRLRTSVVLEATNERLRGEQAEHWIADHLMSLTDDATLENSRQTLVDGYYLQQESLRGFLTSRSDDERFAALSQMVGAGSLSEFVRTLESAKNSWSRAITGSEQELTVLETSLRNLQAAYSTIASELDAAEEVVESEITFWIRQARLLVGSTDKDAETSWDHKTLAAALSNQLRANDTRRDLLLRVAEQLETLVVGAQPEPFLPSQSALDAARQGLVASEQELQTLSNLVTSIETSLQRARDQRQELATMAALALRHLGDQCPACGQRVEQNELRIRLSNLVSRADEIEDADGLSRALAARSAAQTRAGEAQAALRVLSEDQANHKRWEEGERRRVQRMREVETTLMGLLNYTELPNSSDDRARLIHNELDRIERHTTEIRKRLVEYGRFQTGARLPTLRSNLEEARQRVQTADRAHSALRQDIEQRRFTHQQADLLVRALRADSEGFLNKRLMDIQPILDQLYAAIDPHPTFRDVKLETRNSYGKNRLMATLTDAVGGVTMNDPGTLLSTSQANAVAVALFLAFNLGLQPTRLATVVLDDPLQNLDDIHLLGLVDLLRRLLPHRQIIVTTHDIAFASLLTRKLRPVRSSDQLHLVRISKWDRSGVDLYTEILRSDPTPLKLAQ